MNSDDVLVKVIDIFKDVFDEDDIIINRGSNAENVEDWDSLNHIMLIVEIEKCFDIKFDSSEIAKYSNVGEMCDAIALKQK